MGVSSTTNNSVNEIDLRDILKLLLRKWKVVIITTAIGALIASSFSFIQPKLYKSDSALFIQSNSLTPNVSSSLPIPFSITNNSSTYILSLLNSDTMARNIVSKLHLEKERAFCLRDVPVSRDFAIQRFKKTLNVSESKGLITISITTANPKLSAKIVNAIVDHLGNLITGRSEKKIDYLSRKLEDTENKLRKAEDDLLNFQKKNDITAIDKETSGIVEEFMKLDNRLLEINVELEQIQSTLDNSGDLNNLVELEVRKKSLEASRDLISDKLNEMQRRVDNLPSVVLEYARLQRNVGVLTKTYELLTQQYQMANISQYGEDGDYQIIDRARPIMQPVSPKVKFNTLLGGMIGFLVSAFLVMSYNKSAYTKQKAG